MALFLGPRLWLDYLQAMPGEAFRHYASYPLSPLAEAFVCGHRE